MSRMDKGYGSEWHLAQCLRHRRRELDASVAQATGERLIEWLDAPVDWRTGKPTKEWRGIDFLPADPSLDPAWSAFWPTGRGVHSWNAVGRLERRTDRLGDCRAKTRPTWKSSSPPAGPVPRAACPRFERLFA